MRSCSNYISASILAAVVALFSEFFSLFFGFEFLLLDARPHIGSCSYGVPTNGEVLDISEKIVAEGGFT